MIVTGPTGTGRLSCISFFPPIRLTEYPFLRVNRFSASKFNTQSKEALTLEKVMEKVFPGVITAPFIMVGSTDSKFYSSMSKCVLRFAPILMEGEDLARVHGTNERIRIDNLVKMEDFYYELLKES